MLDDGRVDAFYDDTLRFLKGTYGHIEGRRLWAAGANIKDHPTRVRFYTNLIKDIHAEIEGQKPVALEGMAMFRSPPVDIRTFICDEYFLNKSQEIFPLVLDELEEMCSGKYTEIVCTGGIGSAKTTCALYGTGYQQYLLSMMVKPHANFQLDPSSEILTIFQSISRGVSEVSFRRFKDMIQGSKYFKEQFPWDKDLTSKLVFPRRIEVTPVSGAETAAIGQNVIGGLIDELNYMTIVTQSKKSVDSGQYDQAVALYNSIARRRESRFGHADRQLPGLLYLVSSKRYPGQFTDIKEAERDKQVARDGYSRIYIYDKRVWDIKPAGSFPEERFHVFAGDLTRRPRVLLAGETVPDEDRHLVVAVPETQHYRSAFEGPDIINALREIAGMSTLARHPFILNVEALTAAMGRHVSVFTRDDVDFHSTKLGIIPKNFINPGLPRWVHVDLAITGDSAGLAIGTVTGFTGTGTIVDEMTPGEIMPMIHIDGMLEIKPPKGGEILFYKIRETITALRKAGMNIKWVSYDSFQSRDSLQILKQQGYVVGITSIDTSPVPYDYLKSAIYTRRIKMPAHPKARLELVSLEKDTKTGKIDHPAQGSKDISDALAGVVHGLTNRREVWGMFKIPFIRVPDAVKSAITKQEKKEDVQIA